MSLLLTLAILVGTVAVTPAVTRVLGRDSGWPLAAAYLAAAAAFFPAAQAVMAGEQPEVRVEWIPALGAELALRADGIGVVFTYIALLIGAVVFTYSTRYLSEGRQTSFYLLMAAFTLSMVGLVLSDDLVLLFLCWELTSLASFLLIARSGPSGEAGSMRTLQLTFLGGLTLLVAVGAIAMRTGTTNLGDVLAHPVWQEDPGFTAWMALLVLLSAFTKSAQFPFHFWLPDAMAAATPVSAYLHAAAVVKAGIFLLMRFSPAFHQTPLWTYTLVVVGLFTAAMAALFAASKTDLKKLMAYSTVSQLGLIVATIGIGTSAALAAAVLHTIAHALFKSGLFMMVGVVDHAAHTREIRRLPPLRHKLPGAFVVMVLGCASMAGVPPLLGFLSKEAILTSMREAQGPEWFGWAALLAAAGGAVLTFAYCVKIVFGAFVDGERDDDAIERPHPVLLWSAALPIVVGLPLAFVIGILDTPVEAAAHAAVPDEDHHVHLTLWHGLTVELGITAVVLALGVLITVYRRALRRRVERALLPTDGATLLDRFVAGSERAGAVLARAVARDHPTPHVIVQLVALSAFVLVGSWVTFRADGLAPQVADLSRPVDVAVLVITTAAVLGVVASRSRLGATVALGAVGIVVTVQIFSLGAPDVGLTQLLVESLTVIVIMLVLQKLPAEFGASSTRLRVGAGAVSVLAGLTAFVFAYALTGRRERSAVSEYYLVEGPEKTGGDNIVNTILVEFRALDTLGELTVLGMAGIAIIAVLSTMRHQHLDPPNEAPPRIPLRERGSTAYEAMESAWGNAVPLQLLVRLITPLLAVISAVLFWRGHNAPGGGFIAALVGSGIVALLYLSAARSEGVGPPRLPVYLISGGVLTAVGTGIWGMVGAGSFLEPTHHHVLGQDLSSAIVFDLGVYSAVLGLVMVAFNLLGASSGEEGQEGTRERTDEAVLGELTGPLDTTRGEPADPALRVGRDGPSILRRTSLLSRRRSGRDR